MSLNSNGIKITTIAGPPYVAIILNWGLFGVLSLQVYLYSQAFPNDKSWLKVLVCVVYLLEMAQTFLLTDTIWNMLVVGFGNPEALDEIGTAWLSVCLIGGLMGFCVQWFYAYRIIIISRKWIIPSFISIMSLIAFSGSIATAINLKQEGTFSKLLGHDKQRTFTTIGLWAGTGSICDVVIAVCMCYYLLQRSQRGKFARTEALVSKVVRMTIETGALTATISISSLIVYYPSRFNDLTFFEVPLCVHAKIYSTTMLAVLNSRMKLGIVSESTTWRDNELGPAHPHSRDANRIALYSTSTDVPLQSITVHVTKEETITTDDPKVPYLGAPNPET